MRRLPLSALLVTLLLSLAWVPAHADTSAPATAVDPAALTDLRPDLAEIRARQEEIRAGQPVPAAATAEELVERDYLLEQLVANLQHAIDAADRLAEMRTQIADQETRARDWTGFPNPGPYSILLVDRLREQLANANSTIQAANGRTQMMDQQASDEEQAYKAAEAARRQAEEKAANSDQPAVRARQDWLTDLTKLRARTAAIGIEEGRRQKMAAEAEISLARARAALLTRQLAAARTQVDFPQSDLDGVLANLDRQHQALRVREQAQVANLTKARQRLVQAQARLEAARAQPLADAAGQGARLIGLQMAVDLEQRRLDNADLGAEIARRLLDIRSWERNGWQMRWLLINSKDNSKLHETLAELDQLVERLRGWNRYLEAEINRSPAGRDEVTPAPPAALGADQSRMLRDLAQADRDRLDLLRSGQGAVSGLVRTLSIWRQDFLERGANRSAGAMIHDIAAEIAADAVDLWRFELFTVEDSVEIDGRKVVAARSVTVGKSAGALLVLLIGYGLSGWVSQRIGQFAVRRLNAQPGHAGTLSRWMRVVFLVLLAIMALYMVNIPLTVFAFLGGALAIGLGFGTQVLLKNLVSGIMLLLERPLKVGDRIEVGAIVGVVTNIGIRSSTVRTSDGIEILVPNSTFIENNVTNWTYSNAKVRRAVTVGVDYAADPLRVRDLLRQVAVANGQVLTEPTPQVLLQDFGADALIFTVQYWIDYARGTDGSQVASELRFAIAAALGDAGIGIPYPQRVVRFEGALPAAATGPVAAPDQT